VIDPTENSRDHGGNLAEATARWGGEPGDWLDLSTGINPVAYPLPPLAPKVWTQLPGPDAVARLEAAAARAYEVAPEAAAVAAPGASVLIAALPRLAPSARVLIQGRTYNEHAAAFAAADWTVLERPGPGVTAGVIVNPNNPDGRRWEARELLVMAEALDLLVVDESFMDATPEASLTVRAGREGLVILRSFGKFYGLAGLRLGFAVTGPRTAARLREMLGPWAISGPAADIGAKALADHDWAEATRARLGKDIARLETLAAGAGWGLGGKDATGTPSPGTLGTP